MIEFQAGLLAYRQKVCTFSVKNLSELWWVTDSKMSLNFNFKNMKFKYQVCSKPYLYAVIALFKGSFWHISNPKHNLTFTRWSIQEAHPKILALYCKVYINRNLQGWAIASLQTLYSPKVYINRSLQAWKYISAPLHFQPWKLGKVPSEMFALPIFFLSLIQSQNYLW